MSINSINGNTLLTWRRALPAFLSAQTPANLAALDTVLAPVKGFLNGPQLFALVQSVGILRAWTATTSDGQKLSDIGNAVNSLTAANATLLAMTGPTGQPTNPLHIGMGGSLVAALANLT